MRALRVILRVTLALGGGYVAAAVWSAALALGLRGSVARAEAAVLAGMLGFVFLLVLLLWLLTTPQLGRAGLLVAGLVLAGVGLARGLSAGAWPSLAALAKGG
jgi:uncharacterized membrane protein YkgB